MKGDSRGNRDHQRNERNGRRDMASMKGDSRGNRDPGFQFFPEAVWIVPQ